LAKKDHLIGAVTGRKISVISGKAKWSDPSLKPGDLVKLAKRNPRAYSNPNLPFEVLLEAAGKFPWFVEQNPVLGLLGLEEPAWLEKLQDAISLGWNNAVPTLLSMRSQRRFALEIAESVLPIYKKSFPTDPEPKEVLKAVGKYLSGKIGEEEFKLFSVACSDSQSKIAQMSLTTSAQSPWCAAYNAATAIFSCAMTDSYWNGSFVGQTKYYARLATQYAAYFVKGKRVDGWVERGSIASQDHTDWQNARFRDYFYTDHPECKLVSIGGVPDWSDPEAKPADLVSLVESDPRVYMNPNLPFQVLMEGARLYPWYVDQNPYLALAELEDPRHYQLLMDTLAEGWLAQGVPLLSPSAGRLFGADCAEHVLEVFESRYPGDYRPRHSIYVARKVAAGEASEGDGVKASEEAQKAIPLEAKTSKTFSTTLQAVRMAAGAAAHASNVFTHLPTARAASYAMKYMGGDAAELAEKRWQASRVRYYYAKEHPEYELQTSIGALPALHAQCILVDKSAISTVEKAMALVKRLGFSAVLTGESKTNWRFQQQPANLFIQGSFVTKPITNGVRSIMAQHRPEVAKHMATKSKEKIGGTSQEKLGH
jgi:hypothetical protein